MSINTFDQLTVRSVLLLACFNSKPRTIARAIALYIKRHPEDPIRARSLYNVVHKLHLRGSIALEDDSVYRRRFTRTKEGTHALRTVRLAITPKPRKEN